MMRDHEEAAILPTATTASTEAEPRPAWERSDALLALAGMAAIVALALAAGLPKLAEPGMDNDSLMRLVTVRDLLAGQSWYDLHQYRMGSEGGFLMHWSRLVDAPIAALTGFFSGWASDLAAGERVTAFVWPALLSAAALFLLIRLATLLGGAPARLPALAIGALALHSLGIFQPGSFDHHNVQLVLVLLMCWGLAAATPRATLAAGAAAALSLAVGMETMPYVAAAGLGTALLFWRVDGDDTRRARGFGAGFAATSAAALAVTVRPAEWFAATCDAFSGGQAATAIICGAGLAGLAAIPAVHTPLRRLAGLAALGVVAAAFVLVVLPQCLAAPYADLPERLRGFWLDWITEAQSIAGIVAGAPADAAAFYVTPLIALVLLGLGRGMDRVPVRAIVGLLLAVSFAVSLWQARGAMFSVALAVVPLAVWVDRVRRSADPQQSAADALRLAAAWLVSVNLAWGLATAGALWASGRAEAAGGFAAGGPACLRQADFDRLATLGPTTILAVSNHGAAILAYTPHHTLAGPYHRNIEGNLAAIDAFTASPAEARQIARRHGVGLIVVCAGNPETQVLAALAPAGLLANLLQGQVPGWLRPYVGNAREPLKIYATGQF